MKTSRYILPALLATALMGGMITATNSQARPYGGSAGYDCGGPCQGNGGAALTPEQRSKYDSIVDTYSKRMDPVRDQVFVKSQELSALHNAATPDVKAVREAASELNKLKRQMGDMHDEMMAALDKEGLPIGRGMGHGGMGRGMGHGGMGRGMGHGGGQGMGHGGMGMHN